MWYCSNTSHVFLFDEPPLIRTYRPVSDVYVWCCSNTCHVFLFDEPPLIRTYRPVSEVYVWCCSNTSHVFLFDEPSLIRTYRHPEGEPHEGENGELEDEVDVDHDSDGRYEGQPRRHEEQRLAVLRLAGDDEEDSYDEDQEEDEEEGCGSRHGAHPTHDDQVEDENQQVQQPHHFHDEHAGLLRGRPGVHPGEYRGAQIRGGL